MAQNRRLKIILAFLCLVTVYGSMAWGNPKNISGFALERTGWLAFNLHGDVDITQSYQSFPLAAGYLSTLSIVTGWSVLQTAYFPFVMLFSFIACLTLSQFLGRGLWDVFAAGAIFVYFYSSTHHFQEYKIAIPFYLLFMYFFYRYWSEDQPRRIGAIAVIMYAATKFYGLPYEVWLITLITLLILLLEVAHRFNKSDYNVKQVLVFRKKPYIFAILGVVSFFSYNKKFYGQFLAFRILSGHDFGSALTEFFTGVLSPKSSSTPPTPDRVDLAYSITSPWIVYHVNMAWYLMLGVPIALSCLYYLIGLRGRYWKAGADTIYALAATFAGSVRMVVYIFVGAGVSLRYIMTTWPILSAYFVKRHFRRGYPAFVATIFLLALVSSGYIMAIGFDRPFAGEPHLDGVDGFLHDNTGSADGVLVNHRTYGELRAVGGEQGRPPDGWQYVPMDDANIRELYLASYTDPGENAFDYVVFNLEVADRPVQAGPPMWKYYDPMTHHQQNISSDAGKNQVYKSEKFVVYQESSRR